jgi:hypothetical protein
MSKIYCAFCGEENDTKDKKCKNTKCKRELNPKSHLFRNYVIDKCKGDIDDSLFNCIFNYIKTNLFGFVLSISIVSTIAIVVTNAISNNYITELNEEPIFNYAKNDTSYSGTGLSSDEIVDLFIEYVKNKDLVGANNLIANNHLTSEQMSMIPLDRANKKYFNKIKHDFVIYNDKFFDHIKKEDGITINKQDFIGRFADLDYSEPSTIHNDNFDIKSYYLELNYCLKNDCSIESGFTLMEIIETIKIDGNVYILSEYAFLPDNYSRVVRYIFDSNDGNFANMSNNEYYKIIDTCLDDNGKVICDLPIPEYGKE